MLLLVFVSSAEELLEEVLLLGLRGLGRVCVVAVRCGRGNDRMGWGSGQRGRRSGLWIRVFSDTEDLLDEVLWVLGHLAA